MAEQHIDENDHYSFASGVINGMNLFYGIPIKIHRHPEDSFFNNDIRWAIATLSYLFRKDFFKIFSVLDKGLKNEGHFEKYCMLIFVTKNDRYFFNFLRRVSLIYEMAAYCFRNGNNYFLTAGSCIAKYQDKEYFQSVGSWRRLNLTAAFLRELGNPLLLVILEESTFRRPLRFAATVERIENRIKYEEDVAILSSEEMKFLVEQKEKFLSRERDGENADSQTEKERAFSECLKSISGAPNVDAAEISIMNERKAIIEYFGSLLSRCSKISKSPLEFEKLFLSNPNSDEEECSLLVRNQTYFQGSSSNGDNSQPNSTFTNDNLSFKYQYSSSGSPISSENNNPSYNEASSVHLSQDLFLSDSFSEDENVQECSSENKYLEHRKDLESPHTTSSTTENYDFSEYDNLSNSEGDPLKQYEEYLHDEALSFCSRIYCSENVPTEKSALNGDKQDNANPEVDRAVVDTSALIGADNEIPETTSKALDKPINNAETKMGSKQFEDNLNTNTENSHSLSQKGRKNKPNPHGRKNKRKKKGKRK